MKRKSKGGLAKKLINVRVSFWILLILFAAVMGYLALAKHWGLKTQMNDLGNVLQAMYNTSHGRLMEMTNTYSLDVDRMNRLAGHANFIYLLLVPVYWLVGGGAQWLIGLQMVMVALGAVPLFWLGKKRFGEKSWWALMGPVMYWLNPMIQDGALYDVHAAVIAVPLILWSFWFWEERKWKWLAASLGGLMLFKEDMSLVVVMLGLGWWLSGKTADKKKGLITMIGGLVYFVVVVGLVMPWLSGGEQVTVVPERYGHWGEGLVGIVKTVVTRPDLVVAEVMQTDKLNYIWWLMIGAGGVGVLVPRVAMVTVPSVMMSLLSSNPIMYQPWGWYYATPAAGVMVLASWWWLGELREKKQWLGIKWQYWVRGVLSLVVLVSLKYSPVPYSLAARWSDFQVSEHAREIEKVKELIPTKASLSVQNNLGAHLAERAEVIVFPYRVGEVEYVLVDVTDPYAEIRIEPRQENFIALNSMRVSDYEKEVRRLLASDDYGLIYTNDGYLLFKKGVGDEVEAVGLEERFGELRERYDKYEVRFGSETQ